MSPAQSQTKAAVLVAAKVFAVGLAVLLVWFLTPASVSTPVKILLVLFVLLVWPVLAVIKRLRRSRAAGGGNKGALPPPTGTYEELTRGTEEAVQWLRGTKLGGGADGHAAGEAAYALPWYVIAGPPASGKTSLLQSAGLSFQVLPSQRASEQNVIRPTRNCEWRVTDSAIWLDTSGRYQTEGPERDEWAALIETVKRHRRARPLDGLVLAVSAAEILRSNDAALEQQAKVLRARLDEAAQRAGHRFPVYLVFTHMDEVEGFAEFFHSFGPEERAQVWGSTFPLASADKAQSLFDAEFDYLYARLVRRRVAQLGTASAPDKQLRVFKFPGRFRRARARLGHFAAALFRPNPFSESPLLRGFYFTSARGVGPAGAKQLNGAEYFSGGLFRNVILPDRNVVAAAQAARARPNLGRNLLAAAAAALVLLFGVGMVVSFFNNKSLIADADARGKRLTEIRKVTSRSREDAARINDELAAVEDVRLLLAELDDYERESPPLFMRFGLYSGGALNSSDESRPSILRHLYFEAVNDQFLKPTLARVEQDLRRFTSSAAPAGAAEAAQGGASEEDYLGRHYDLLKAYLMLSKPDRVEPTFLANTLREYWEKAAPAGAEEVSLRQLEYFASQAGKPDAPHPEVDNALVAQAQDKLVAYPVVNRVYKRITADINAAVKYPVRLSTIPGAREGNFLTGSYSVPGAFTLEGYREMKSKLDSSAADEFRRDDWVMRTGVTGGEQSLDVKREELAEMYYRDYVAHWQRFLQDVKLRDFASKEDAVRALRALSGSNSPLEKVLREVERQTNLSGAAGGLFAWVKGLFGGKAGAGATPVEREFRPLAQFMSGKDEASPMAEYRTQLKKVGDALNTNPKPVAEISKAIQAGNDTVGLRAGRQAVADTLEAKGFNATPAGDAAARLLKLPLDNLNALLVGTDFEQMEKAWQALAAKARGFESAFPFADGGDASLAALAQFLNPQDGELTKFFNERLKPYFEDDWSVKREASDKFAPEFVTYLGAARRLRDALFPGGGKQPKAEYQVTLQPAGGALVRVEIDGNLLSTPDKTSANFVWPGDKSGVRVTVTPTNGQDQVKTYPGEWGVLRMFRETGGGDGKGAEFALQPQAGVRLVVQPKSGGLFQREPFAAFKAPQAIRAAGAPAAGAAAGQ